MLRAILEEAGRFRLEDGQEPAPGRGEVLLRMLSVGICGSDLHMFREATIGLRSFEMPEDLQQGYGYAPVTEEVKRMIFGENLGKLLGIDTSQRRAK